MVGQELVVNRRDVDACVEPWARQRDRDALEENRCIKIKGIIFAILKSKASYSLY